MIEEIVDITIKIRRVGEETLSEGPLFLGKRFDSVSSESGPVVLVHPDYPNVTEDLIISFFDWVRDRTGGVVSGTVSPVHPYRLIKLDKDRHERYMVNVSQEIRGNRHLYPEVHCFRPALVYLPHGVSLQDYIQNMKAHGSLPELYPMDPHSLLDKSLTLDGLLIRAHNHEGK